MSKSLDFVKSGLTDEEIDVANLTEMELDGFPMKEPDSDEILWESFEKNYPFIIECKTKSNKRYEVELIYNPDTEFECCTGRGLQYNVAEESITKFNLIASCFYDILSGTTGDYGKGWPKNLNGSKLFYTFGNAVIRIENLEGETPWMEVMIPFNYNFTDGPSNENG